MPRFMGRTVPRESRTGAVRCRRRFDTANPPDWCVYCPGDAVVCACSGASVRNPGTRQKPGLANVLSLSRTRPSRSGSATRSVAQNEARKRRATERHVVGCCEELGGLVLGSVT